jgi:hypothetical protein
MHALGRGKGTRERREGLSVSWAPIDQYPANIFNEHTHIAYNTPAGRL